MYKKVDSGLIQTVLDGDTDTKEINLKITIAQLKELVQNNYKRNKDLLHLKKVLENSMYMQMNSVVDEICELIGQIFSRSKPYDEETLYSPMKDLKNDT